MRGWSELTERLPKTFWLGLALIQILFLSWLDYATGPEVAPLILFLIPVMMVTRFAGRRAGFWTMLASAAATFTVFGIFVAAGRAMEIPWWMILLRLAAFLVVTWAFASLNSALQKAEEQVRTDALTGLDSRRQFFRALREEMARSRRHDYPFTVAYIDVDDFKAVNDRAGHDCGDDLLREAGRVLQENVRRGDTAARLGGDEFAVLLPEIGGRAAEAMVEKLENRLREAMKQNGFAATFSIGAVTFLAPAGTVDEILRAADRMMYAAKRGGKDRMLYGKIPSMPPRDPVEGNGERMAGGN